MWGLLGPGIKPTSPALVDGLLTTGPPGMSLPICFTMVVYTHQSQFPNSSHPPPPCPFSTSLSLFLPCKWAHLYHFSRFHIYALINKFVFIFLTYFTLYDPLGPPTCLRMTQCHSLLWLSNSPFLLCKHYIFMPSSVNGHLGCFHILAMRILTSLHFQHYVSKLVYMDVCSCSSFSFMSIAVVHCTNKLQFL